MSVMRHRCSVLPATIVLLVVLYLQCLRLAPASVLFAITHTHAIACIVTINKSITNQDAVVIRRYPEYIIIMVCIKWIVHMHRFTLFFFQAEDGIRDVLRVADGIIL